MRSMVEGQVEPECQVKTGPSTTRYVVPLP